MEDNGDRDWSPEARPPHLGHLLPPRRHAHPAPLPERVQPQTAKGNSGAERLGKEGAATGNFRQLGETLPPPAAATSPTPVPITPPPSRPRLVCRGSGEAGGAREEASQGCQLWEGIYTRFALTRQSPLWATWGECITPCRSGEGSPKSSRKSPVPFSNQPSSPHSERPSLPKSNCSNFPKGRQMRCGGGGVEGWVENGEAGVPAKSSVAQKTHKLKCILPLIGFPGSPSVN